MNKMTITQEQLEHFKRAWANPALSPSDAFSSIGIGITIAPPQPPEAMVKLAQAASGRLRDGQTTTVIAWEAGYVAALQHAADVVKNAPTAGLAFGGRREFIDRRATFTALGAA